ncbi:hypothetical protein AGMMS50268_22680 [Spirochaetia bacterium]|nr:hypothetical protein AGMMS50268_22680 [Spirochaetia bacterium]
MEQPLETDAARLLDGVTGIIKRYEAQWQKTGEKYNLFKVAGIAHKEVIMCRVLADLMNPQGTHGQGSRFLRLFWETIAPKLPDRPTAGRPALDIEHTRVTTEYVIDENRRIDITFEDGKVFVPIEVKIWAGDQPKQIADYFAFAKTKNGNNHIPVLYLTVDGHEPSDASKAGIGKDGYVPLSFRNDILVWLEACARENTAETTVPVRENLRQLIAVVKSLCGKSEDAEMEDAIFKLVTKDDDSVRAALAISGAMDFGNRALDAFKGPITTLVQKAFPDAVYTPADGWYMIQVPINNGNYLLDVNYDWKSFDVEVCVEEKERNRQAEERMAKEMAARTNHQNEAGDHIFALYGTNRYPGLETVDEALYFYRLWKEYTERPQEVANRIIGIAKALESVH